jgi:hypothetical protein
VKRGYVDFSEHWRYSSYRNYFDTGLEVVFDGVEVVVWAWERDSSLANNYERQRVISPVQRFVIFCMLDSCRR